MLQESSVPLAKRLPARRADLDMIWRETIMKKHMLLGLCVALGGFALQGCANKTTTASTATMADKMTDKMTDKTDNMAKMSKDKMMAQEEALKAREAELASKEAEFMRAKNNMANTASASSSSSLLPPNPKVGECYARVVIPAKFETRTEKVLEREAAEKIEVIPAKYRMAEKKVLVTPAKKMIKTVPATYKTVSEKVLVRPARTEWKKGSNIGSTHVLSKKTSGTGELMCLVNIPAEYKPVSKQVVATPATTRVVEIPAVYKTVKVTETVTEAREVRKPIAAKYSTVSKKIKTADEYMQWKSVLCKTNMTRDNVSSIQRALRTKSYYSGPVDGLMGPATLRAASRYAEAKNLPIGSNFIAMEVVRDLGLNM